MYEKNNKQGGFQYGKHKTQRRTSDDGFNCEKIFSDTKITAEFIRDILELPVESVKIFSDSVR